MPAHHAEPKRKISPSLIIGAGVVGAVALALVFGAASLEIAKFGAPHNVALQAAQIGLGAPAQAAPAVAGAGYLPAQLGVQAHHPGEELPPQF
jgi:hypothetical protein